MKMSNQKHSNNSIPVLVQYDAPNYDVVVSDIKHDIMVKIMVSHDFLLPDKPTT
jgi:hypothetical protein